MTIETPSPIHILGVLKALDAYKAAPQRRFVKQYRDDPVAFAHDCIQWGEGGGLTLYQEEILAELCAKRRVCVRGPRGLGKTCLMSVILHWYALTRDGEDWKVPTTAGAWRQLTKFLWPEIHKWARKIKWDKVPREPYDTRNELISLSLKLNTGEAFAVASDTPDLIEGSHADCLLYIYDESKAIGHNIFDAVEGSFSGAGRTVGQEAFAIAVSTPGERSGRFYDIQSHKPGYEDWWVRHVTLDETLRAGRVTAEWVEQRRKQWGETSPIFQAQVLGEFPEQTENTLISLAWVDRARENELEPTGVKRAGVDVARYGDDDSVEIITQDGKVGEEIIPTACVLSLEAWNGHDLMQTAGRVKFNGVEANIDTIGVGAGVYDRLQEEGFTCTPINVGERADDHEHFFNLRTELYWKLREDLREGRLDLSRLSSDDFNRLEGELVAIRYEYTPKGQLKIEPKEDIKKRLEGGKSPDYADALMLTRSTRPNLIGIHVLG